MEPSFSHSTRRPVNMNVDLSAYAGVESYPSQEDLNAWRRVRFTKASRRHDQHLDIGCGLGNFTRKYLLPYSRPCRRLVAVDSCPRIIEYARERSSHLDLFYDVLDIEKYDDVTQFIDKYGKFDRVYSFMCFHFVKDQSAAYRNVGRLLAEDGECVVVSCVSTELTDIWLQVHETQKWKSFVPNPKDIFSTHFRFNCVTPARQIEEQTMKVVTESGLHCVTCEVYENEWTFPDIDTIIYFFFSIFGSEELVPDAEKDAYRNVWRTILGKKTEQGPEGGRQLKFLISVTHLCHRPQTNIDSSDVA
ncbi:juvenile hormone acid O-methyltransferase-like [Dermacentor andersoni]|uniref:juvenile hormone acid O-methyltransferase-like n=1 Tax=Dermacentor andersoni TaxID=34620 RepID=UPI00215573E5|nr:juvenile hormone acid O-methyltransferase-like [Dermacentor andersoni]